MIKVKEEHTIVWVRKWVDYSVKYGMGFQLSNGIIGILFNDSTKIISGERDQQAKYIYKAKGDLQETLELIDPIRPPSVLDKKVKLFTHFKKFFLVEQNSVSKKPQPKFTDDFYLDFEAKPEAVKDGKSKQMQMTWESNFREIPYQT